MPLEQISMREFVAATAGAPRFHAQFTPYVTHRPDLHTSLSREIGLFHMEDGSAAFILFNRFVGGDAWNSAMGDYTDPVWETVVLRSVGDSADLITTGLHTSCHLEWPGGLLEWSEVAVESFVDVDGPIGLAVTGALAYTASIDGCAHEFLVELRLCSASSNWRVKRSLASPQGFTLATDESTPCN